jgi:hypothetical protein
MPTLEQQVDSLTAELMLLRHEVTELEAAIGRLEALEELPPQPPAARVATIAYTLPLKPASRQRFQRL